jgi:hypothetical protein
MHGFGSSDALIGRLLTAGIGALGTVIGRDTVVQGLSGWRIAYVPVTLHCQIKVLVGLPSGQNVFREFLTQRRWFSVWMGGGPAF